MLEFLSMKTTHIASLYIQGILAILGIIIAAALIFACIQLTKTNERLTKTHDLIQKVYPEDPDERKDIVMLNEVDAQLSGISSAIRKVEIAIDRSASSASYRGKHIEKTVESIEEMNTTLNNMAKTMKYFEEYAELVKKYLMPPIMTIEPIQPK